VTGTQNEDTEGGGHQGVSLGGCDGVGVDVGESARGGLLFVSIGTWLLRGTLCAP
jgi:hypothetical protein